MDKFSNNKEIFEPFESGQKTIFVFGAGIEKSKPIDLPLAEEIPLHIISEVTKSGNENIKKVAEDIKKYTSCSFSFDKLLFSRVKEIFDKQSKLGLELNEDPESIKDDYKRFITYFLNEIANIKLGRSLGKLKEAYGAVKDDLFFREKAEAPEITHVVNVNKVSLHSESEAVLEALLKKYIFMKKDYEEDPDNFTYKEAYESLKELFNGVVDFDALLTENYLGLLSNIQAAKSRYCYLSWLLWLLLSVKDKSVCVSETIYSKVMEGCGEKDSFITLNYTTFIDKAIKMKPYNNKVIHFHGDLKYCIEGREEKLIEGYEEGGLSDLGTIVNSVFNSKKESLKKDGDKFGQKKENENVEKTEQEKNDSFPIPMMMPPLTVKPLISNKYLNRWIDAYKEINAADRIIVVGYSFSEADNHFNDMLFHANPEKIKEIIIVNKSFENKDKLLNKFDKSLQERVYLVEKTAEAYFEFRCNGN